MAFATTENLEARWRTLSDPETVRAATLLGDAAWWLGVWFKPHNLVALAAGDEELAEGLVILSCAMVKRAMTSGAVEGAQSTYQMMGPFTAQVAFKNPDGNLFVYEAERDAIFTLLGVNTSGAVSMTGPGL